MPLSFNSFLLVMSVKQWDDLVLEGKNLSWAFQAGVGLPASP